jgi:hypothetical protein
LSATPRIDVNRRFANGRERDALDIDGSTFVLTDRG